MKLADAAALAALRLRPGLEVAEASGEIWLRGGPLGDAGTAPIDGVPAVARHVVAADGALVPPGARVPVGRLPDLKWTPLRSWAALTPPEICPPSLAAPAAAAVRLAPGGSPSEPAALLAAWDDWEHFALTGPIVRLRPLRFARAPDGPALIVGRPVPPVPGVRFVAPAPDVLVPAGRIWTPPVPAAALRERLGARPGDVVFWRERDGALVLPPEVFVPATRGAVRASASP